MDKFPTDYPSILARLQAIDPLAYARTRNYLHGAVTRLSPYITHGVITTQHVGRVALAKASFQESEKLLKELAWRDFYYAMWNQLGEAIFEDLRYPQPFAKFSDLPSAIPSAQTGITAIDTSITELVETGYIHNHARLWLAMLCCNISQTAWWNPSRWMYYHLLDGDLASNTISWQWVAGSYRKEPYIANQENINAFSGVEQHGTFLDVPYEKLLGSIPTIFQERAEVPLSCILTPTAIPSLAGEVLLYHPWSLDPLWQESNPAPRILLLEPDHFANYPISQKRLQFILRLSRNIQNLEAVVANFTQLQAANPSATFSFTHHPAITHWEGVRHTIEPLFVVSTPVSSDWSFTKFWAHSSITLPVDALDERV